MKYLHIVRHGKAATNFDAMSDFNRPLIQKGIDNSLKVIAFLQERDFSFDLAVSSPAKRAYDTAVLFSEKFNLKKEDILTIDNMYDADLNELFDIILNLPNEHSSIAIFGHNPTLFELVNYFGDNVTEHLPTSSVVSFSFNTDDWQEVLNAKVKLDFLIFPQMIEE
jgi:phosphohistidine phosphatase